MLHRYSSAYALLEEATELFNSFDIEDIKDDGGLDTASVIIDTILSGYGHNAKDTIDAIESFGGTYKDCCTECIYKEELREDCEWLHEVLEDVSEREAEEINDLLETNNGYFYFDWQDGAFYLLFAKDIG